MILNHESHESSESHKATLDESKQTSGAEMDHNDQ